MTTGIDLAPDRVGEVFSPSTGAFDRAEKMPVYARSGVRHAWLVDPLVRTMEVFRLDGATWRVIGTFRDDARVRAEPFEAPPPSSEVLADVVERIARRVARWLGRHGHARQVPEEDRSNEPGKDDPLTSCLRIASAQGTFATLLDPQGSIDPLAPRAGAPRSSRWVAVHERFNRHAGVTVAAGQRTDLERLFRYGARPALALDRLERDARWALFLPAEVPGAWLLAPHPDVDRAAGTACVDHPAAVLSVRALRGGVCTECLVATERATGHPSDRRAVPFPVPVPAHARSIADW